MKRLACFVEHSMCLTPQLRPSSSVLGSVISVSSDTSTLKVDHYCCPLLLSLVIISVIIIVISKLLLCTTFFLMFLHVHYHRWYLMWRGQRKVCRCCWSITTSCFWLPRDCCILNSDIMSVLCGE